MTWAPEINRQGAILRIPAFIQGYAAAILEETLPALVDRLSRVDGEFLKVSIEAGEKHRQNGKVDFELGEIVIAADRLTERFDPAELRREVDQLVNEAMLEGDAWAERNQKRAQDFLSALAEPP